MMPGPTAQPYVPANATPTQAYPNTQPQSTFDATGQIAPPGMKPRVTATLWEDEGSLCFQVEAKGVCVARRERMFVLRNMYFPSETLPAQNTDDEF